MTQKSRCAAIYLLGRRTEQQDAFICASFPAGLMVAVADGHDKNGDAAARLAISRAKTALETGENNAPSLTALFARIHRELDDEIPRSGTTLTIAITSDGLLTTAYVGDSEAWIFDSAKLQRLTVPHRYRTHRFETERLDSSGAPIQNKALALPSGAYLAITRALGDVEFEPYVLHRPEIRSIQLKGTERFLLVGTDGFWDTAAKRTHRRALEEALRASRDVQHARELILESLSHRPLQDNCTLVIADLQNSRASLE